MSLILLWKEDLVKKGRWSKEDDDFLIENYSDLDVRDIASHVGRSDIAVLQRAHRLRKKGRAVPTKIENWLESEDNFLKENYSKMSNGQLADKLGRSYYATQGRLVYLGIKREKKQQKTPTKTANPPWSDSQDDYIKTYYNGSNASFISKVLGRTRSSVISRAYRLNRRAGLHVPIKGWTEQEEQYMLDHYKFKRNKDIAQHLGKTARSVEEKARRMGLGKAKTKSVAKKEWHRTKRRWTQEEESFLIANMELMETKELAYNLGRTVGAVGSKLRHMRESFQV